MKRGLWLVGSLTLKGHRCYSDATVRVCERESPQGGTVHHSSHLSLQVEHHLLRCQYCSTGSVTDLLPQTPQTSKCSDLPASCNHRVDHQKHRACSIVSHNRRCMSTGRDSLQVRVDRSVCCVTDLCGQEKRYFGLTDSVLPPSSSLLSDKSARVVFTGQRMVPEPIQK